MSRVELNLDAWPLRFPRTGLGNVTANLIRDWVAQGRGTRVRVLAPAGVEPATWGLDPAKVEWISLPNPAAAIDYVARWQWSRQLTRRLARESDGGRLFVPYLYNHWGRLRRSVVLVPDLVYRMIPFADFSARPWWDVRGRFYLRRLVMRAEEKLVRRARAWVVYSQFVAEDASRALGLDAARVRVSTLGAGPAFAKQGPAWADFGREPIATPYVVYVGGYGFRKNVPMLVDACIAAVRAQPEFRCVLAGISPERFLADPQFNGRRGPNGVPEGIICFDDIDDRELAALYRGARFAVFPSLAEGFGLPVVEAAACGRFCLTADNTSLRELQPDERLRLPDRDAAAWTAAMLRAWHDEKVRREAEAGLPALLQGRSNPRFADDVWTAVEEAFA